MHLVSAVHDVRRALGELVPDVAAALPALAPLLRHALASEGKSAADLVEATKSFPALFKILLYFASIQFIELFFLDLGTLVPGATLSDAFSFQTYLCGELQRHQHDPYFFLFRLNFVTFLGFSNFNFLFLRLHALFGFLRLCDILHY